MNAETESHASNEFIGSEDSLVEELTDVINLLRTDGDPTEEKYANEEATLEHPFAGKLRCNTIMMFSIMFCSI